MCISSVGLHFRAGRSTSGQGAERMSSRAVRYACRKKRSRNAPCIFVKAFLLTITFVWADNSGVIFHVELKFYHFICIPKNIKIF